MAWHIAMMALVNAKETKESSRNVRASISFSLPEERG